MCSDPKGGLAGAGHFGIRARYSRVVNPNLFGTRDQFRGRQVSTDGRGVGRGEQGTVSE